MNLKHDFDHKESAFTMNVVLLLWTKL